MPHQLPRDRSVISGPCFEPLEHRELFSAVFDELTGTLYLSGSNGRDRISVVDAGDGRVSVSGVSGPRQPTLFSGVQAIEIHGLGGADDIFVGDVVDPFGRFIDLVIFAGGGNDTIITGRGDDHIDAGDGNNKISSDGGDDTIITGRGKDLISAGSGDDDIDSGDGPDKVFAGSGNNIIDAGDGNNIIIAGTGSDIVAAGDGHDLIFTDGGNDLITAGNGKNSIDAGSGDDAILTGDGADRIFGGSGDDDIDAGDGNNIIDGGAGFDEILAGIGNDTIYAGNGDDLVDAGLGDNRINLSDRASARFRFKTPPLFVIAKPLSLIAHIDTYGLTVGPAAIVVNTIGDDRFPRFGDVVKSNLLWPLPASNIFAALK